MATPPSDDTRMLFKILADGQWHSYDEVRDEIAAKVPPGRALRKYQENVDYARKYKGDPTYDTEASEDERIYYGSRRCAQNVITSWKGKGVMFTGSGPTKEIRIKPGFKSWGVVGVEVGETDEVAPPGPLEAPEGQRVPEVPAADSEPSALDHEAPDEPVPDVVERPIDLGFMSLPEAIQQEALGVCRGGGADYSGLFAKVAEAAQEEYEESITTEGRVADAEYLGDRISHRIMTSIPASDYQWPSPNVVAGKVQERCPECHLLVVDRAKHADWHLRHIPREQADKREDMALFAESEIRTLLGDAIQECLDAFQVGMQEWMQGQFQQLEAVIRLQNRPGWKWSGGR